MCLKCSLKLSSLTVLYSLVLYTCNIMAASDEMKSHIRELIDMSQTARRVATMHKLLNYLVEHKVASKMRVPPRMVVVHRHNRDSYGLNWKDVHGLCDDLVDVGFVDEKAMAILVEVTDEDLEFNRVLFEEADGNLGNLEVSMVRFASLGGSHSTFVLRIILDEVLHQGNQDVCIDGRLSMAKLREKDASLAKACGEGLMSYVLPKWIIEEFPELAQLLQSSANTEISKGEHELQVLRRIHTFSVVSQQKNDGRPDFADVKKQTLASKPVCAAAVPHMYVFALRAAGGQDGQLLKETEALVRANAPSSSKVGGDIFKELANDMTFTNGEQALTIRHGLLARAYIHGDVGKAEAKRLFGKEVQVKAVAADKIMCQLRTRLHSGIIPTNKMLEAKTKFGYANMWASSLVIGIKFPKDDPQRFTKVEAIAHEFILALSTLSATIIKSDWLVHAENPEQKSEISSLAKVDLTLDVAYMIS
jgi:hypothetical protein